MNKSEAIKSGYEYLKPDRINWEEWEPFLVGKIKSRDNQENLVTVWRKTDAEK